MLHAAAVSEKEKNREYFLKVISSVHLLARQGLALCGDGDEANSNILQLLHLCGEDFEAMKAFLDKPQLKYTSHHVHNELLSIMALQS